MGAIKKVWRKMERGKMLCYRLPVPPDTGRKNRKWAYRPVPLEFTLENFTPPYPEWLYLYDLLSQLGWDKETALSLAGKKQDPGFNSLGERR